MNFDRILLRLKEALGTPTDKETAELLGMSKSALAERKRRDAFPEDKLLALKAKHPELGLDITYILTGRRATTKEKRLTDSMLSTTATAGGNTALAIAAIKQHSTLLEQRSEQYERILELLNACSDESVSLIETLIDKLRLADLMAR